MILVRDIEFPIPVIQVLHNLVESDIFNACFHFLTRVHWNILDELLNGPLNFKLELIYSLALRSTIRLGCSCQGVAGEGDWEATADPGLGPEPSATPLTTPVSMDALSWRWSCSPRLSPSVREDQLPSEETLFQRW